MLSLTDGSEVSWVMGDELQPPGLKSGHFEIAVATYAQRFSDQVGKAMDLRLGRRWPRSGLKLWPHCYNTLALQPHVLNAGSRFGGVRKERPHTIKKILKHPLLLKSLYPHYNIQVVVVVPIC